MDVRTFTVGAAHAGERLDRFLQAMIPRMSRASVQEALLSRVTLGSGLSPKPSRRLSAGDVVTIRPRDAPAEVPPPPRVVLEHEDFFVVDKPAGMSSVPHARHPGVDAATLLGAAPAHRLDRFTSGCLLLTRNRSAATHFVEVFTRSLARKTYAAVVAGFPQRREWTAEDPIAPDAGSRVPGRMRAVAASEGERPPDARSALTHCRVVAAGRGRALVLARPATGRRHQVRVHLAAEGHAVVGDLLYGGDERRFIRWQLGQDVDVPAGLAPGRFLLHARSLEVPAPDGEIVRAVAPWPEDFPADLVSRWQEAALE